MDRINRVSYNYLRNVSEQDYKFRGITYKVTMDNFDEFPNDFKQSFAHFAAKNKPPSNGSTNNVVNTGSNNELEAEPIELDLKKEEAKYNEFFKGPKKRKAQKPIVGGKVDMPADMWGSKPTKEMIDTIKKYLLQMLNPKVTEHYEEKLYYPKVFEALLSNPSEALEQTRKRLYTEIKYMPLILYVDMYVSYHQAYGYEAISLHNAIWAAACELRNPNIYIFPCGGPYNDSLPKHVLSFMQKNKLNTIANPRPGPGHLEITNQLKGRTFIFTQGCGAPLNFSKVDHKSISLCTIFNHSDTCGCDTLPVAKRNKVKIYHEFRSVHDFRQLLK